MEARSAGSREQGSSYRSPMRVPVEVLQRTRDPWKANYKKLQERVKAIRTELRDLRRSRDRPRAKAEDLEHDLKALREEMQRDAQQRPSRRGGRSRP